MSKRNAPGSLAVCRNSNNHTPYTAEELLALGIKYAQARRIGKSWIEDAAQEFAIAGLGAIGNVDQPENIRAFQIKAGKWAVANLWRSLHRNRIREEKLQRDRFGNFDNNGIDPEILVDKEIADPLSAMISAEDASFLQKAIIELPAVERSVLCAIVFDGWSQKELAHKRKVNSAYISKIYITAIEKLKQAYQNGFEGRPHLREISAGFQRVPQNLQRCEPSVITSDPRLPQDGQGLPDMRFDLSRAM